MGQYLRELPRRVPELRARVVEVARRNLGQPLEMYLLGEYPFENYDPQPLYCLKKTDCMVFVEQAYAMALSSGWASFVRTLQRIRYRDGQIGVVTRNHFTEADWMPANRWLVRDLTAEIAGGRARTFTNPIDRGKFLWTTFRLRKELPKEIFRDIYLPVEELPRAEGKVATGDLVAFVRAQGFPGEPVPETVTPRAWVGHLGLIARGADGALRVIHAAEPAVQEERLSDFLRRTVEAQGDLNEATPQIVGVKFLRLEDDPIANLRKIEGDDAPRVRLPNGMIWKIN